MQAVQQQTMQSQQPQQQQQQVDQVVCGVTMNPALLDAWSAVLNCTWPARHRVQSAASAGHVWTATIQLVAPGTFAFLWWHQAPLRL
jgi:Tfp pilus assembly protein PilV